MNKIIRLVIILTILLIFIDQISKIVVKYKYEEPIGSEIIGITLVQNEGIAFGLNSDNAKNIFFTMIILIIIINFIRNQKDIIDTKTSIAISLILAGGISNLIDRIVSGGVVDFIKIKYFAIFNIADCYIVIGWILLIIFLMRFEFLDNSKKSRNKEVVGEEDCKKQ